MQAIRPTRMGTRSRRRYSSRPFILCLLLISIFTTYAFVIRPLGLPNVQTQKSRLSARAEPNETDTDCRAVHHAADQCAFILANCEDDEAGLLHYLTFYYCGLGNAKPLAFTILTVWLGLLFTTIGIAASDFFSINLSTIARVLGLSESLAGVTFLAFGNGSPDVFSTFAAMGSNSGSMAVGELIGAAGFITAVVAGSMALVREFKVSKRTFVRDIVFFIAAISFTVLFLADGELHLWECFTMIGFYLFYVVVVVGWHWFTVRKRRQRQKEIASRTHLLGTSRDGNDELEPYRDLDDDEDNLAGGRSSSAPEAADISVLERGPRIEIDGRRASAKSPGEDEEQRELHVAAEMTSNMRVNRPRWGRSNTTIAPVRPSLVGVLEFRSVLSSLNKARNMHMGPLPERQYSDHARQLSGALNSLQDAHGRPRTNTMPAPQPATARERALSHGHIPLNLGSSALPMPEVSVPEPPSPGVGRTTSATIDGRLAPPSPAGIDHHQHQPHIHTKQLDRLQLQIPPSSRGSSGRSSPALSPFPGFTESPAALTPLPTQDEPTAFMFPVPSDRRLSSARPIDDFESVQPKPIKWWPYSFLPPPHVLLGAIFPTLQGWSEKSWWDKIVSLISVPSIFVLVTTLPVVETDDQDDDSEVSVADPPNVGEPGHMAVPVSVENGVEVQRETEWQEFRRRTRSISSRSPRSASPHSFMLNGQRGDVERASTTADPHSPISIVVPQMGKPIPAPEVDTVTAVTELDQNQGWNRWLIALQLFTGPLFVVFIGWANMYEDFENPKMTLLRLVLYSLIVSLVLLGTLLLLTTAEKKPKYHFVLCFLGFVISIAWISTVAGEVVGVLKAFGVILGISEAILGLTIFAVGNSLGDLVADVTVARLGFPVMALAACFGGPMLNILLGVGIGGAWMGIASANKKHLKHPDKPLHYKPYHIQVGGTLMISAVTVLLTLIVLLIVVPSNNWIMSRKIGWLLIAIWSISTVINLAIEVTGTWSDVS
ncbi:hypothetical protein OQA88_3691 [Cercophora sp. LCS_1]